LFDPDQASIPEEQWLKALDVVESWMVRRMLVRATTKHYNKVVAELVGLLRKPDRTHAGDVVQAHLAAQPSASSYWPDDDDVRTWRELIVEETLRSSPVDVTAAEEACRALSLRSARSPRGPRTTYERRSSGRAARHHG
jgi:hypothetical protein